jgi:hypothetical protein
MVLKILIKAFKNYHLARECYSSSLFLYCDTTFVPNYYSLSTFLLTFDHLFIQKVV